MTRITTAIYFLLCLSVPSYAQEKDDAPKLPPRIVVARPAMTQKQLTSCRDEAFRILLTHYYPVSKVDVLSLPDKEPENQKELDSQITAMAKAFNDQYTRYTSFTDAVGDVFDHVLLGKTDSGVGLEESQGSFSVQYVQAGTRFSNHLRKGDILGEVKGTKLQGKKLADVEKLLNSADDKISVTGKDADGKEFSISAEKHPTDSTSGQTVKLMGTTLYLRLASFSDEDVEELVSNIGDTLGGKDKKVEAIVLDLRGNPGGLYRGALTINALFIKKGTLSIQLTRKGLNSVESKYSIDGFPKFFKEALGKEMGEVVATLQSKPMFVLTDRFTASSAEICSGALQDCKRARVIGESTFGKHCGYEEFRLGNGGTLQVTTMLWLTPNGRSAEGKGLAPDRVVLQPRGAKDDVQLAAVLAEIKALSTNSK